eukprot:1181080-Prorocentrum_minimum.AAC.1
MYCTNNDKCCGGLLPGGVMQRLASCRLEGGSHTPPCSNSVPDQCQLSDGCAGLNTTVAARRC